MNRGNKCSSVGVRGLFVLRNRVLRQFPWAVGLAVLAVLLLALPRPAQAAIMIDDALKTVVPQGPNGGGAAGNNAVITTPGTMSYTVSPGASVLVVQFGLWADNNAGGSSQNPVITWDGLQMTQAVLQVSTRNTQVYAGIYYMDNPPAGTFNIALAPSTSGRTIGYSAFTLSGVAPGAPIVGKTDVDTTNIVAVTLSATNANSFAVISEGNRVSANNLSPYTFTSTQGSATQQWGLTDTGGNSAHGGAIVSGLPLGSVTFSDTCANSANTRSEMAVAIFSPLAIGGTYTWTGATNANWNTSDANWSGSGTTYAELTNVNFNNNAGSNNNISITGTGVSPYSVTFGNSTTPYSFLGQPISGNATVTLSSTAGNVAFNSPNTYNGLTTINGGVLQLGNSAAVQSSTVAVNAAGGLTFSPGIGTFGIGGLSGNGSLALADTAGGAITLQVGGNSATTTYSGSFLASSGSLTKVGGGKLTLSGNNLQTGATTISAGTLAATSDAALGDPVALPGVSIGNGAAFDAAGTFATSRLLTIATGGTSTIIVDPSQTLTVNTAIAGAGALTKNGGGSLQLGAAGILSGVSLNMKNGTLNLGAATQTVGAVTLTGGTVSNGALSAPSYLFNGTATAAASLQDGIAGASAVIVNAPGGIATLSGTSTYTGGTTITAGTAQVTNPASFGDMGGGVLINNATLEVLNGFTTTRQLTFNATGAALQVDAGQTYSNNTPFLSNGNTVAVTKTGAGTLLMASGVLLPQAPLTLNGGMLDLGGGTHTVTTVTLTSGTLSDGALAGNSYLFNGPATATATLQDGLAGPAALTVTAGTNTAVLAANNTYSGVTTINTGTLQVGAGGSTGMTSPSNGIVNNATLAFNRSDTTLNLNSVQTISGSGSVVNNGSGQVTFPFQNTYTGGTVVNAGTLVSAQDQALGSGPLTVAASATTSFTSQNPSVGGLAGGGKVVLGNLLASPSPLPSNLTVNNASNTLFSGVISEAVAGSSLTKAGTAQLTMNGTSSFTGGVFLNAGTLAATPPALGSSPITINGGSLSTGYAGVNEGWFVGNGNAFNTTGLFSATTLQSIQTSPRAANWTQNQTSSGSGVPNVPATNFPDNTTVMYQGYIYLPANPVSFYKQFDDSALLKINGVQLFSDSNYNVPAVGTYTAPNGAGWYSFEARFGQGGGGVGPNTGFTAGFGYDPFNATGGTVQANYITSAAGLASYFVTSTAASTFANNITVNNSGQIAAASPATYTGILTLNGGTLTFAGPSTHNITGQLTGSAALNVGNTALTLSGNGNNFNGPVNVNAGGTLFAANTAGSATGSGATTIAASGTLGGSGIIGTSPGQGDVTVLGGGILAPHTTATGVSTLTIASNLNLQPGSILNYNLLTPGGSDLVNVLGNVSISASETLNISPLSGFAPGNYDLMSVASSSSMTGSGSAFSINGPIRYNYALLAPGDAGGTPGELVLSVIAAPSSGRVRPALPGPTATARTGALPAAAAPTLTAASPASTIRRSGTRTSSSPRRASTRPV